jgi:hypothetical protein
MLETIFWTLIKGAILIVVVAGALLYADEHIKD